MKRDYPRLSPVEFGATLIATGDLDPVYLMLNRAALPRELLERFCVAYWYLYRVDAALEVADTPEDDFWIALGDFALVPGSIRGAERRHFRGGLAASSIRKLRANYPEGPARMLKELEQASRLGFGAAYHEALRWPGCGFWVAFKIADMAEAVLGYSMPESPKEEVAPLFYEEVVKGAYAVIAASPREFPPRRAVQLALELLAPLSCLKAPHWEQRVRLCGGRELETVLCKYKAHLNGHYPIGKDTFEVRHSLFAYAGARPQAQPLAARLLAALPPSELDI